MACAFHPATSKSQSATPPKVPPTRRSRGSTNQAASDKDSATAQMSGWRAAILLPSSASNPAAESRDKTRRHSSTKEIPGRNHPPFWHPFARIHRRSPATEAAASRIERPSPHQPAKSREAEDRCNLENRSDRPNGVHRNQVAPRRLLRSERADHPRRQSRWRRSSARR